MSVSLDRYAALPTPRKTNSTCPHLFVDPSFEPLDGSTEHG
ncbi:hypothetical protein LEMLEM_LOCUS18437 [Lemmus lemmus]